MKNNITILIILFILVLGTFHNTNNHNLKTLSFVTKVHNLHKSYRSKSIWIKSFFTQLRSSTKMKETVEDKLKNEQGDLLESGMPFVEMQDGKKWKKNNCTFMDFLNIKCDTPKLPKVIFLRSHPTPLTQWIQRQTWNFIMGWGCEVDQREDEVSQSAHLDAPWYINDIRIFDFQPLQQLEVAARPDKNIGAMTGWMQLAPILDILNNELWSAESKEIINHEKGHWIVPLLALIFFILFTIFSMIPIPIFAILAIICLILFILMLILHKYLFAKPLNNTEFRFFEQNIDDQLKLMDKRELKNFPRIIQSVKVINWGNGFRYQGFTTFTHGTLHFNFTPIDVMLRQRNGTRYCIVAPRQIGGFYQGIPCSLAQEQVPGQLKHKQEKFGFSFTDPVLNFRLCMGYKGDSYTRLISRPCQMCFGRCQLQAVDHFTYQIQKLPDICMTLDDKIDKKSEDIVESVTGNSIMNNTQTDACSKKSIKQKVKYDNMLQKSDADWKSAENDEFVEVDFKMNISLPLFLKYMVIMWSSPPLKFNILCMKQGMTTYTLFESFQRNESRFTFINFDNAECLRVKIQMFKFNEKLSVWRKRCDGTPMMAQGIKQVKVVKDFGVLRMDRCTYDSLNARDQFFTTNFLEDTRISGNQKLADAEERLNKVLAKALEMMPLMRTVSNNFLGLINLGVLINQQYVAVKEQGTRKVPLLKLLSNVVDKEPSGNQDQGSSSEKPAQACDQIKMFYPQKASGFQWLQPICRGKPIRVYCMFENGEASAIFFSTVNEISNGDVKKGIFKDVSWYENTCSMLGVNWNQFAIKKFKQLKTLMAILKMEGQDMSGKLSVPISQDGSCHSQKKCVGLFSSIGNSDVKGSEVQDKFFELLGVAPLPQEENSPLTQDLIGIQQNTLVKMQLDSTPVLGLACSTNFTKINYAKASCKEPLQQVSGVQLRPGQNFQLVCPKECEYEKSHAQGFETQHTNSSPCKAGAQMDAFNDQMNGLIASVTIVNGQASQKADAANGIISEELNERSTYAFQIEMVKCPSKDFMSKSFIQKSENIINLDNQLKTSNETQSNAGNNKTGTVDDSRKSSKETDKSNNTVDINSNDANPKDNVNHDSSKHSTSNSNVGSSFDPSNQSIPSEEARIIKEEDEAKINYLKHLDVKNNSQESLLKDIKGFRHKVTLKKLKKMAKEEMANYFSATLESLDEFHSRLAEARKKQIDFDDDSKFSNPFVKIESFRQLREAKNIHNFNDLLQFFHFGTSKDSTHPADHKWDEFLSFKTDKADEKQFANDMMRFSNVFVADVKDRIFKFAEEDKEYQTQFQVKQEAEENQQILDQMSKQHMKQLPEENQVSFKKRVLRFMSRSKVNSHFPGGSGELFFADDPQDQVKQLDPTLFPEKMTKKIRIMQRQGEMFFESLTMQMKILNGISLSYIATADFNQTMHLKTFFRSAPIVAFQAAIANKFKNMIMKADGKLQRNMVILQNQVPRLQKQTKQKGQWQLDPSGALLIPDSFFTQDSKKMVNGPGRWKLTNKNVSPHGIAILNESDISNQDGTSTQVFHKFQTCFDCVIGLSVNVQTEEAIFNFMFKFIDSENQIAIQFNYLKRFKMVQKKVLGKKHVVWFQGDLESMPVGWFRLIVDSTQWTHKFWEVKEEGAQRYSEDFRKVDKTVVSNLPPLGIVRDSTFYQGKVVFACSTCAGIMIDFLQIKHKMCVTELSMANNKIVAPLSGRWSLLGKNDQEFHDAFLSSDYKANKRSDWKLIVKSMGQDVVVSERKAVFNKLAKFPASMIILATKDYCSDMCKLKVKRLAHKKCQGVQYQIKQMDSDNYIGYREQYGMIAKSSDYTYTREVFIKIKGTELIMFKSTADLKSRQAAERHMTIASFLPRQFEVHVIKDTIKIQSWIGLEEMRSVFFDSSNVLQDKEGNFPQLKKIKKLKGPFSIGVNKCNAQFSQIHFGPTKQERKVHQMEKAMSKVKDQEENSVQVGDSMNSANTFSKLSGTANTLLEQIKNLNKSNLRPKHTKDKCSVETDISNVTQFCDNEWNDFSAQCNKDQCEYCCKSTIPFNRSKIKCRRECMTNNKWLQNNRDYGQCRRLTETNGINMKMDQLYDECSICCKDKFSKIPKEHDLCLRKCEGFKVYTYRIN